VGGGIALVQLFGVGVGAALWPSPSEAEQVAALIHKGMAEEQWRGKVKGNLQLQVGMAGFSKDTYRFDDGSFLYVSYMSSTGTARSAKSSAATPIAPLTGLRRTLARVFPFLME
jgi:hypothetical protein